MTRGNVFTACRTTARGWRLDRGACLWAVALLCLIFFGISVASAASTADTIIQLPFDGGSAGLKRHALYRPDVAGDLPADQLLAGDAGFMPYDPAWEENAPPMWVKLKLRDTTSTQDAYVLLIKRRFFQRLDLYLPDGKGGHKHISTGLENYHPPEIAGNEFVYRFDLGLDNRGTILLHVKTIQGNLAPLSLTIETPLHFEQQQAVSMWAYGLYFGAMLALIFYNLVLYFNLRNPGHRLYVVAMVCVLAFMGLDSGLLQQILPQVISKHGQLPIVLITILMTVATARFFQSFSNSSYYIPSLHNAINIYNVILMLLVAAGLFISTDAIAHFGILVHSVILPAWLLLLFASIWTGTRGSSGALLFFVAWSVFILGAVIRTLISLEILERAPLTEYSLYIGSVMEAMILALGLSYRVGQLRTQRNIALREHRRATQLANVDPLTGTCNRRFLEAHLEKLLSRSDRRAFAGSLIMMDVDDFKAINDEHGHAAGDQLLIALSQRCKDTLRAEDVLARLGGDEFAIILLDRAGDDAVVAAERIHQAITERPLNYDEKEIVLHVSIGIVTNFAPEMSAYEAFKRADEAMYRAKRKGKNQVAVVAGTESSPHSGGKGSAPLSIAD